MNELKERILGARVNLSGALVALNNADCSAELRTFYLREVNHALGTINKLYKVLIAPGQDPTVLGRLGT